MITEHQKPLLGVLVLNTLVLALNMYHTEGTCLAVNVAIVVTQVLHFVSSFPITTYLGDETQQIYLFVWIIEGVLLLA